MTDCLLCGHDDLLGSFCLVSNQIKLSKVEFPECSVFPVYSVYSVCLSCTPYGKPLGS